MPIFAPSSSTAASSVQPRRSRGVAASRPAECRVAVAPPSLAGRFPEADFQRRRRGTARKRSRGRVVARRPCCALGRGGRGATTDNSHVLPTAPVTIIKLTPPVRELSTPNLRRRLGTGSAAQEPGACREEERCGRRDQGVRDLGGWRSF